MHQHFRNFRLMNNVPPNLSTLLPQGGSSDSGERNGHSGGTHVGNCEAICVPD